MMRDEDKARILKTLGYCQRSIQDLIAAIMHSQKRFAAVLKEMEAELRGMQEHVRLKTTEVRDVPSSATGENLPPRHAPTASGSKRASRPPSSPASGKRG